MSKSAPGSDNAGQQDHISNSAAPQRFLEDRYGHLWLVATGDVLIEWSPWSRDYIESTKGPLTEWSDPNANA